MSTILYYSNHCNNCRSLIGMLAKTKLKDDINFLCIDKRVKGNNNATYIVLENQQQVLLPPHVTKVPALLLLNRGNQVIFGEQIYQHFRPLEENLNKKATFNNGEPMAYSLGEMNSTCDAYSYLDQSPDEMTAKGQGGLRQMHNYVALDQSDQIETPPDTYSPDKVGEVSMDQLRQQREQDVNTGARKIVY